MVQMQTNQVFRAFRLWEARTNVRVPPCTSVAILSDLSGMGISPSLQFASTRSE